MTEAESRSLEVGARVKYVSFRGDIGFGSVVKNGFSRLYVAWDDGLAAEYDHRPLAHIYLAKSVAES